MSRPEGDLAWTADGCQHCLADLPASIEDPHPHFAAGCFATLPWDLVEAEGDRAILTYRCPHGHAWTTNYDRSFAEGVGRVTRETFIGATYGYFEPSWPEGES